MTSVRRLDQTGVLATDHPVWWWTTHPEGEVAADAADTALLQ